MRELKDLSFVNMGYGWYPETVKEALKWEPDVIVGQGTSTDPGPGYLGSSDIYPYTERFNQKKDAEIIALARENNIPFIVSAGTPSGSNLHLEGFLRIVDEICKGSGIKFRAAVISGEVDKEYIKTKLAKGEKMRRLVDTPRVSEFLTLDEVDRSVKIVSQMGPEPIMKALGMDVDGVITGRALDVGLHMAMPLKRGFDKGLAAHMAKVIECGALAAVPEVIDIMFGILREDHFLVKAPNPSLRCTVRSVAGHSFYERPDPSKELNPGGYLDISEAKYEQVDERTVKVWGSKWVPSDKYFVKIEGIKPIGYRTINVAGIRDPRMIKHIDPFLESVSEEVRKRFAEVEEDYTLMFRVYGKNGVLSEWEPKKEITSHELCIITEAIAKTQELATAVVAYARGKLLFWNYPGRTTTAGNVACPYSPFDIKMGEAYVWNIWHLMELDDPCEPFKVRVVDFPRNKPWEGLK